MYDTVLCTHRACRDIGEGRVAAPDLLGSDTVIKPVLPDDAFDVPLAAARIDRNARRELIERYASKRSSSREAAVDQTQSGGFSSTFERYDSAECEPFTWT